MKSRIIIIYERLMPTVSAMRGELEGLFKREGIEVEFKAVDDVTNDDLNTATTVMLVRPENVLSYRLAKSAKKRGSFVITFCDDDLLNLPKQAARIPWRKNFLRKTLAVSDEFESPSPYLCEKYSKLTPTGLYSIGHTTVSEEQLAKIPTHEKDSKIKLVYAAGRDHVEMFNQYIMPVLPLLAKKYKDRITLTMVGVHPDIEECNKYIPTEYVEGMGLEEYREYMRTSNFDIGLAPLSDTPFHRCKYFNKFIEYTLVGVTGIYSNVAPYTYAVNNGVNGLLADDSVDSWLEQISKSIEDAEYRTKSLQSAIQYLRDHHSVQSTIDRFRGRKHLYLDKDIRQMRSPLAWYRIEYKLQRVADLSYMTMFTITKEGLKATIDKMKHHNRDVKKMAE